MHTGIKEMNNAKTQWNIIMWYWGWFM